MGTEETAILSYLKTYPHQFVSGKQIARKAAARKRFDKEPHWAVAVLARMVREKLLLSDNMGGFKIAPEKSKREEDAKFSKKTGETIKKAAEEAQGAELEAAKEPPAA